MVGFPQPSSTSSKLETKQNKWLKQCFKVPQHLWWSPAWSPAVNELQALHASTNINIHQQNPMYTSTACWQRLSTRQCTAWPLHPTRRRGLLWQRALLHSSHRNTNLGKNPEQSLANASGEDCVRKHWHVRTWQNVAEQNIVWTQRRAFAVEASGNPGDGGNPAGDSAVTSAGRKWKKSEPAMAIYTCMSPTQEQKNLNIMN